MRTKTILFTILLTMLAPFANSDSATQTDWNGGPGVLGPVAEWGSQFYISSDINWTKSVGNLHLSFEEVFHSIGSADGAWDICPGDIDDDGDIDILIASAQIAKCDATKLIALTHCFCYP